MNNTTNCAELLASIMTDIAAGRTVYVSTALRRTVFSPKTVAKIRAAGAEPFKLGASGDLRMLEGWTKGRPRFVTIGAAGLWLLVGLAAQ